MKTNLFRLVFATVLITIPAICTQIFAEKLKKSEKIPYGVMDPLKMHHAYKGAEKLHYEIAYTGGIKLGELRLEVSRLAGTDDSFELYTLVTTEDSVFNLIYPVRDIHITTVSGEKRYPLSYEVWQKEGYNYEAHKLTTYDQQSGMIHYQREGSDPVKYTVVTPVHNEFSSFFASRVMKYEVGSSFLVPTFADKKRAEVEVQVQEKVFFEDTAVGPVGTLKISPVLTFKGLYDKRGDTTIWYTDDNCRVPVQITSKLAIGSVTATLLLYENPACKYRN